MILRFMFNGVPTEFGGGALRFISAEGLLLTYSPFLGGGAGPQTRTIWTAEWAGITEGALYPQDALDRLSQTLKSRGVPFP